MSELGKLEDAIVADAKAVEADVASVFTGTIDPALQAAWTLIERNGGSLLLKAATDALPAILTGNWSAVAAQVVVDAKAAGAATLAEEEQLAASTALQVVQAAAAVVPQNPTVTTATASTGS